MLPQTSAVLAYKLHLECSRLINLVDWSEVGQGEGSMLSVCLTNHDTFLGLFLYFWYLEVIFIFSVTCLWFGKHYKSLASFS